MPSSPPPVRLVRFGIFEADFQAGELRKAGVRIKLQDQPLQILAMLVEHPEELVTREEIRQKLWPGDTFIDFDHGLNNAINRLRDAIGDSAESPRFIETLPRRGYRFIGTVNGTATKETVVVGKVPPPAQIVGRVSPEAIRIRGYGWIALATGALLAAVVAGLNFGILQARLFPGTLSPVPIRSLAVLPLQNLSGDASQEYLADGMTEALITDLAKISSLRVISRTSAMHYKGSHQALPEITRELNVDAVVEGSVARLGNRVRVTAQLVQAPSDRHLWAESYERDVSDILQLQNDLASAVAEKVNGKLTPLEQQQLTQVRPVHPEAYEDYLRGRYFGNLLSEDSLQRAKEYFERAIQKDPNYAPAYAGLAVTYNLMTFSAALTMGPDKGALKAIEAANKALQLDANLAEPHAVLGVTRYRYSGDWMGAEQQFQRAIELDPGYANAYLWYGQYLENAGRDEHACANLRKARQLDPLNSAFVSNVARCLLREGKHQQAVAEARTAVDLEPRHVGSRWALAGIYEQEGRFAEAIAEYKLHNNPYSPEAIIHALWAWGRRAEAERMFREKLRREKGEIEPWCGAIAYLGVGDNEGAIQSLERAVNEGSPGKGIILAEWRFAPLRSDPRFRALLRRVGVPGW
jgi:TolB-like protein/DNA-binding winged helix-turn-helix (wHTH) protein/Tfp pilus assembly protein PilF